jgi:ATP-binding cassette, subfamily B, bacterial
VGVVTQDVHLFHDTIRANLLYANPRAPVEELADVIERAQLRETIMGLPQRLDTVVGDRGFRLSGGERQRLALARLMLTSPSMVILDEATSQLDAETDRQVQRALRNALAGRSALIIAHRLSTIREADRVVVLEHGRLLERDARDALPRVVARPLDAGDVGRTAG